MTSREWVEVNGGRVSVNLHPADPISSRPRSWAVSASLPNAYLEEDSEWRPGGKFGVLIYSEALVTFAAERACQQVRDRAEDGPRFRSIEDMEAWQRSEAGLGPDL